MATRVDRIDIGYNLFFEAPFHFGTGIRVGLIDRTVVRDSGDYLYVPGSTFKGVLRERCEQLARSFEELDDNMRELIASPHNEKIALRGLGSTISMITRIFGSQNRPGLLFFDDAQQTDEEKRAYDAEGRGGKKRFLGSQTTEYTQVRLDRPTRTAVRGALYTSEFGVRNLVLQGSITGWLECLPIDASADSPTYSMLLLLAGMLMIDRLGGNKSTGKGQCKCEISYVVINGNPYTDEQWRSWLNYLEALSYYSSELASQEGEA